MYTRPASIAGWLMSGSPSQRSHTSLPVAVAQTMIEQLSVLNATRPSSTTAAVGPSSEVFVLHSRRPVAASML